MNIITPHKKPRNRELTAELVSYIMSSQLPMIAIL
jgi:hypothetical protein